MKDFLGFILGMLILVIGLFILIASTITYVDNKALQTCIDDVGDKQFCWLIIKGNCNE